MSDFAPDVAGEISNHTGDSDAHHTPPDLAGHASDADAHHSPPTVVASGNVDDGNFSGNYVQYAADGGDPRVELGTSSNTKIYDISSTSDMVSAQVAMSGSTLYFEVFKI